MRTNPLGRDGLESLIQIRSNVQDRVVVADQLAGFCSLLRSVEGS